MATNKFPIGIENVRIFSSNQPTWVQSQDANSTKWLVQFPDGSETRVHFCIPIPANYAGGTSGITVRLRWRGTSNGTNAVVWKLYGTAQSTWDRGNAAITVSATTNAPASAGDTTETTLTISTSTGYAPSTSNNNVAFCIARDGANGSDTYTGSAELLDIVVEWASVDSTIIKKYIWLPAAAFTIPTGSNASLSTYPSGVDSGGIINPAGMFFTDSGTNTADAKVAIPSDFGSALRYYLFIGESSSSGSVGFQVAMGLATAGATADPVLTAQSTQTFTINNTFAPRSTLTAIQTPVVSPAAGQELFIRVSRDTADANTGNTHLYGILFEYVPLSRNPNKIPLDPGSAAIPTTGGAAVAAANDTNSTKQVLQYTSGADQKADIKCYVPSLWASGATLKVAWRSTGTGSAYFRADYAWAASGSSADPALTTGTASAKANSGASQLNVSSFDVSSGAAASDEFYLRFNRLGTNGSDTIAATVEILDIWLEFST